MVFKEESSQKGRKFQVSELFSFARAHTYIYIYTWILWGKHTTYSWVNPAFPVQGQYADFWLKMKKAAAVALRALVGLCSYFWGFVLNINRSIYIHINVYLIINGGLAIAMLVVGESF